MSDDGRADGASLTAGRLLARLEEERERVFERAQSRGNLGPRELATAEGDQADLAQAATILSFQGIESDRDLKRLQELDAAIWRISEDPANFDACQNPNCLGDGRIEHERMAILPWATLCCRCAGCRRVPADPHLALGESPANEWGGF